MDSQNDSYKTYLYEKVKSENPNIENFSMPSGREAYTGAYRHRLDLSIPFVNDLYKKYTDVYNLDVNKTGKPITNIQYKAFEDSIFEPIK